MYIFKHFCCFSKKGSQHVRKPNAISWLAFSPLKQLSSFFSVCEELPNNVKRGKSIQTWKTRKNSGWRRIMKNSIWFKRKEKVFFSFSSHSMKCLNCGIGKPTFKHIHNGLVSEMKKNKIKGIDNEYMMKMRSFKNIRFISLFFSRCVSSKQRSENCCTIQFMTIIDKMFSSANFSMEFLFFLFLPIQSNREKEKLPVSGETFSFSFFSGEIRWKNQRY